MRALGTFVRTWREAHSLTQEEFGLLTKMSHTYVSKIEQGQPKGLGYDVLRNLASGMGVPLAALESLLRGEPAPRSGPPVPEIPREIPIVAHVSAGSGSGYPVEGYVYAGDSEVRGRRLKAVVVRGDCLSPQIPSGAIVIIDQAAAGEVRDGQIVVATLLDTGEHVMKRFYQLGDKVKLEPNIGQPIIVDADRVKIEGVAVEIRQRLVP